MFLVGHTAIGLAVASVTASPVGAFVLGLASHYAADAIPHGDEFVGRWAKRGNEPGRVAAVAALDGLIAMSIVLAFLPRAGQLSVVAAAVVGAVLPDVLWGLELLSDRRMLRGLGRFHKWIHNHFRIERPRALWLTLQFVLAALVWYGLFTGSFRIS
ncbi:hypothetical protein AMJ57_04075 [Parcubacteria bacterium SG8_24]|nr:MAG: hypothetical protein AMJ57_04075 [Parcubacteria bacterium SG8_24]